MSEFITSMVRSKYRGAWDSGYNYQIRDVCTSGGSMYYCNVPNVNQVPPNASYWTLMVEKGADGAQGDTGGTGNLATLGGIAQSLATAANDFLVASGAGVFIKKTLAEVKTILGLGTAAYTASTDYATAGHTHAGSEAFPVGSVFLSVVSTNPATLLGYGTWSSIAAGRALVGLDAGDTDFDTVEETGGAKTKTIAQENLPNISTGAGTAHTHTQNDNNHSQRYNSATTGPLSGPTTAPDASSNNTTNYAITTADATATNQDESAHTHSLGGSGTALNVMNPYFICYMWKRTL